LEIFNDQFRAGSAVRTATDGLRSLILLEDDVRAAAGAAAMPLQPKAQSRGVGFIEFAVSEEKARALAALAGQLGFRKTGAHRSKDVERWCRPYRFVINCEPDGFIALCRAWSRRSARH
jgi:4-hydroxyphenylpyruvate dioxygenase